MARRWLARRRLGPHCDKEAAGVRHRRPSHMCDSLYISVFERWPQKQKRFEKQFMFRIRTIRRKLVIKSTMACNQVSVLSSMLQHQYWPDCIVLKSWCHGEKANCCSWGTFEQRLELVRLSDTRSWSARQSARRVVPERWWRFLSQWATACWSSDGFSESASQTSRRRFLRHNKTRIEREKAGLRSSTTSMMLKSRIVLGHHLLSNRRSFEKLRSRQRRCFWYEWSTSRKTWSRTLTDGEGADNSMIRTSTKLECRRLGAIAMSRGSNKMRFGCSSICKEMRSTCVQSKGTVDLKSWTSHTSHWRKYRTCGFFLSTQALGAQLHIQCRRRLSCRKNQRPTRKARLPLLGHGPAGRATATSRRGFQQRAKDGPLYTLEERPILKIAQDQGV